MKYNFYMMILLIVTGCSSTVNVADLTLPPVKHIHGMYMESTIDGFTLADKTGNIQVVYPHGNESFPTLLPKMQLDVYGNLRPGIPKIFDAYVIKSESAQYVLQQPGGVIMLHIQSPFE